MSSMTTGARDLKDTRDHDSTYSSSLRENPAAARESAVSAISWPAIIGGAFAAAAVSLMLLLLGSALGLSTLSPWSYPDANAVKSFTVMAAIWLIIIQWIASGLGGYLTGRLRTKWARTHADEVFFRDTAHGFLTWAVATVLAASVLGSASAALVSGGAKAGTALAAGAMANPEANAKGENVASPIGYYNDMLFRSPAAKADDAMRETRAETARILTTDIKNGGLTDTDKAYLAQLVAARTGLSETDATKRVDDTVAQLNATMEKTKQAAEVARRTGMHVALYIFLSMLIGAFIASSAAAIGGRQRDELVA